MPLDLPPPLWVPPKPAIIRAAELPRTPAEARKLKLDYGSFPFPFVPPAEAPFEFAPVANTGSAANQTTYTFTSQNLGDAHANREIIVAIVSGAAGTQGVSSVSVGATNLSEDADFTNNDNTLRFLIWRGAVPTGTSATITVTFDATVLRCFIVVYRMVNAKTGLVDTGTHTSGSQITVLSTTVDVPAGGAAIGLAAVNPARTFSWSLANEVTDAVVESDRTISQAYEVFETEQSGLTVSATFSGGTSSQQGLLVATYR